jgi:serine/threonine protein kinase
MDHFARDLNVHPDFFIPYNVRKPADEYYNLAADLLPNIWRLQQDYFWTYVKPRHIKNIVQGWKIHVSTSIENAHLTLEKVINICVDSNTEFKFASDKRILRQLLSKNCSRSASGKFITIYPENISVFKNMLERLHQALKNMDGPYILSDQQYKDSRVVYYRYGGFRSFSTTKVNGFKTSHILDDKHTYIEDQRQASFYLPEFINDQYEEIKATQLAVQNQSANNESIATEDIELSDEHNDDYFDGKYEIESVIKASNAGGVYIAKDVFTEQAVLLKEARPCIGLNNAGADVIEQLEKENRLLTKLGDTGICPKSYGLFQEWEHTFLAQEMIAGITLKQFQLKSNKIIHSDASSEEMQLWITKTLIIAKNIINNIITLHEKNVVFGDLSPNNIMINEESLATTLIDFEGAYEPGIDKPVNIFTPGFAENARMDRDKVDFSDDYFALGATFVSMFMSNTCMMHLKTDYAAELFKELQQDIGLPEIFINITHELLSNKNVNLQECVKSLSELTADTVHAFNFSFDTYRDLTLDFSETTVPEILRYNMSTMNTSRRDRVFPLGPSMEDPLAVDKGVLGVAYAWQVIDGKIPQELTEWIKRRSPESFKDNLPGLLNGLSGTAWALASLGRIESASRTLRHIEHHNDLYQKMSLGYGAAGFGMTNLSLWLKTKEEYHLNMAIKIADILCESAIVHENGYTWEDPDSDEGANIGLYEGSSGVALFLLYIYCYTKEQSYLTVGEKALSFDLAYKTEASGSVGFPRNTNSTIIYPYVAHGSAGIATVALRYYLVTKEAQYLDVINEVKSAVAQKYTTNSGVSNGLAGLGSYMLDVYQFLGDNEYLHMACNVVAGLSLFAVKRDQGITFPDTNRMKVCCDFYDGSAGVALFLDRLNKRTPNMNFMLDELLSDFTADSH